MLGRGLGPAPGVGLGEGFGRGAGEMGWSGAAARASGGVSTGTGVGVAVGASQGSPAGAAIWGVCTSVVRSELGFGVGSIGTAVCARFGSTISIVSLGCIAATIATEDMTTVERRAAMVAGRARR